MHYLGHGKVDRCHNLRCHLYHSHFGPCMAEILGHFQTNESTADNNGSSNIAAGNPRFYYIGIRDIAKRVYAFDIDSGQGRTHRRCSG